jgi:membrane-associated phospholipid phosphatase
MPGDPPRALSAARRPFLWAATGLFLLVAASTAAQSDVGGEPREVPQGALETSGQTSPALAAVRDEARTYLLDGRSILTSPLHWDSSEWARAGAIVAALAILGRKDSAIDTAVQRNRSSRTDAVASAVTPFGSYAAVGVSVAALGGGWLLRDTPLRDTGRDAIEAELFAAGIVTPLLKTITGRLRPSQGSDADEFRTLSGNQSFPSGHATEAFAVASVFAARSDGWVVPTLSYTLASMVGLARVHDRAHFASDVFAGAVIGTAIGRSIVHRHTENRERVSWDIVPFEAQRGAGLAIRLATGRRSPPEVFASRSGL